MGKVVAVKRIFEIGVIVPTTRSLRFAIFWEIFENCQLKPLLNSKILHIVTVFDNMNRNDLVVGTVTLFNKTFIVWQQLVVTFCLLQLHSSNNFVGSVV